jgi:hypothetical protein
MMGMVDALIRERQEREMIVFRLRPPGNDKATACYHDDTAIIYDETYLFPTDQIRLFVGPSPWEEETNEEDDPSAVWDSWEQE